MTVFLKIWNNFNGVFIFFLFLKSYTKIMDWKFSITGNHDILKYYFATLIRLGHKNMVLVWSLQTHPLICFFSSTILASKFGSALQHLICLRYSLLTTFNYFHLSRKIKNFLSNKLFLIEKFLDLSFWTSLLFIHDPSFV